MDSYAISAISMLTAVGLDAPPSAAAARAGLSRGQELSHFDALDEDDTDVGPLVGHIAEPNAIHAEGLGKYVALGSAPLRRLDEDKAATRRHTALFVALPDLTLREHGEEAALADEMPRSQRITDACQVHLVQRLCRTAGVTVPDRSLLAFGDHTTFLRLLDGAMTALAEDKSLERCLVAAIDSCLDLHSLQWGLRARRIKCATNAVGFAPGEAAVFLELVRADTAQPALARISRPCITIDPAAPATTTGAGLAKVVLEAVAAASGPIRTIVTDWNGELDRAHDWGCACARLASHPSRVAAARCLTPASSFGETGCASTALALGIAVEALRRGYAGADEVLVIGSSDAGERGAVLVAKAP